MTIASRRVFAGAAAVLCVCLTVGIGRRPGSRHAQVPAAQGAPGRVPVTDEVFKNSSCEGHSRRYVLRGDGHVRLRDGQRLHLLPRVEGADFDKSEFADARRACSWARGMIAMMNALNKQYFGGQPRVTCFTCHRGASSPVSEPEIALQYGAPMEDPNARTFPVDTRMTADQVFDKYLRALGGAGAVAKLTSYTAKGTYAGFDTSFERVPVDCSARPRAADDDRAVAIGASTRTFDGRNGWMRDPIMPGRIDATEGNLDRARLEAAVSFPGRIKELYPAWRLGRTAIDDKEVQVVQGLVDGSAGGQSVLR